MNTQYRLDRVTIPVRHRWLSGAVNSGLSPGCCERVHWKLAYPYRKTWLQCQRVLICGPALVGSFVEKLLSEINARMVRLCLFLCAADGMMRAALFYKLARVCFHD